jgi:hypothetical protein
MMDEWIIKRYEDALLFLWEWFSISRTAVLRFCIVLLVAEDLVLSVYGLHPLWCFPAIAFSAWMMWGRVSHADQVRRFFRYFSPYRLVRCALVGFTVGCAIGGVWLRLEVFNAAMFFVVMSFEYIYVCDVDGHSGRKRKMAIEELKKMFSWLPKEAWAG